MQNTYSEKADMDLFEDKICFKKVILIFGSKFTPRESESPFISTISYTVPITKY